MILCDEFPNSKSDGGEGCFEGRRGVAMSRIFRGCVGGGLLDQHDFLLCLSVGTSCLLHSNSAGSSPPTAPVERRCALLSAASR